MINIVLARSKRDALDHVSEKWAEWRRLIPNNYRIFTVLACEMVKPDVQGAWEIMHERYTQREHDAFNEVCEALQEVGTELEEAG